MSTYIRQRELLNKNQPVLVALSGGADSVALLDVLVRAGYPCIAAHCNFQLRGEESNRDEQFVRDFCSRLNVPLEVKIFDTRAHAHANHISIEMAARDLRYAWFDETARTHGCQAVAVAHHQNDQAETVLLHLKRGTGLRGLAGMRPKSANPMAPESLPIVRPLLCTNSDTSISRNAIREQLRSYTKTEIEHIAQTAEYMQGYIDILEGRHSREAGIVQLYEDIREYGFAEIDKIYDALQRGEGGKVFTSKTHRATIKKGKLCVTLVS